MNGHVMTDDERETAALDHSLAARNDIDAAAVHPDPVERRKLRARAAGHYRIAADLLDDRGRLSP